MTPELEQLRKLLAEATPGRWGTAGRTMVCSLEDAPYPELLADASGCINADANAALIVAAVNALPELIARVEEMERLEGALVRLVRAAMSGGYSDPSGLSITTHPAYDNAYVLLTCNEVGDTIRALPPIPRAALRKEP